MMSSKLFPLFPQSVGKVIPLLLSHARVGKQSRHMCKTRFLILGGDLMFQIKILST